MKKTWMEPQIEVQQFMANEYIASSCGEQHTVYKFDCNAGGSRTNYHVYLNGPDGIAHTSDDIDWSRRYGSIRTFNRCGAKHEASVYPGTDFQDGYMYEYSSWSGDIGSAIPVVVWTDGGTNTHCTTVLDKNQWETAKS